MTNAQAKNLKIGDEVFFKGSAFLFGKAETKKGKITGITLTPNNTRQFQLSSKGAIFAVFVNAKDIIKKY